MSMTRLWNVTSDPSTDVPVQNLMVLGKVLKPGQSMQIDDAQLKAAHKTKKDIEAGFLAVGKGAPGYLAASTKATLASDLPRAHGPTAAATPAAKPIEAPKAEVKVETKTEEPKKDDSKWGKHKR
jgi:hypothetical protein